jgi:hypothetical protein
VPRRAAFRRHLVKPVNTAGRHWFYRAFGRGIHEPPFSRNIISSRPLFRHGRRKERGSETSVETTRNWPRVHTAAINGRDLHRGEREALRNDVEGFAALKTKNQPRIKRCYVNEERSPAAVKKCGRLRRIPIYLKLAKFGRSFEGIPFGIFRARIMHIPPRPLCFINRTDPAQKNARGRSRSCRAPICFTTRAIIVRITATRN